MHRGLHPNQGHYLAYVKTNCGWYEMNDAKVINSNNNVYSANFTLGE